MSKLGLGLGVNSGSGAIVPVEIPDPLPYNLGDEGEVTGSIIFHVLPDNTKWYETTPTSGLFYVDPVNNSAVNIAYTLDLAFTDILDNTTEDGYDDWVGATIPEADDPQTLQDIDYHQDNSFLCNFLLAHVALTGDAISVTSTSGQLLDIETWEESKLVILFKDIDDTIVICQTVLPETERLSHIVDLNNWSVINLLSSLEVLTIGQLATLQNEDGEYINKVFVAAMRINETDAAVVPRFPAPAGNINVVDNPTTPFPYGINPNVLVAYGDILEPVRLLNTIDRYRTSDQVLDGTLATAITGGGSDIKVNSPFENSNSLEDSILSVTTSNQQVSIKIYNLVQGTPEGPWGNPIASEAITARARFTCLRNSDSNDSLLKALSVNSGSNNTLLEVTGTSIGDDNIVIGGISYTGKVHTFSFDLSGLPVYVSDADKTTLGITGVATVNNLAYEGSYNVELRSMLFKMEYLTFHSQYRLPTRNLVNSIKTARRIVVPTIKVLGAIQVGTNVGDFVLDQQTTNASGAKGVVVLSMETGENAPAETVNNFTFEFTGTMTADANVLVNSIVPYGLIFDSRTGALNTNGNFIYLNNADQVTDFGGTLTIEIDRSSPLLPAGNTVAPDPQLKISGNVVTSSPFGTPTITNVGDVYTYVFTLNYTHQMSGDASYSLSDTASIILSAANNTTNATVFFTIKANSTFTGSINNTPGTYPTTPPGNLIPPPAPIAQYNQY